MSNDRTTRKAAALGLTAGLVGGGAVGFAIGVPAVTTAASDAAPGLVLTQTDPDDGTSDSQDGSEADSERTTTADRLREALQDLVDDGTLTAEQADAVAERLADRAPIGRRGGPGHRFPGGAAFAGGGRLDEIAETLGIDREELADELRSGTTLADIAAEHGIDPADIVDILIADRIARIDEAIAEGDLDAADAAQRKEQIEERATAHVNGEHPAFGRRGGHGRDRVETPDGEPDGLT